LRATGEEVKGLVGRVRASEGVNGTREGLRNVEEALISARRKLTNHYNDH